MGVCDERRTREDGQSNSGGKNKFRLRNYAPYGAAQRRHFILRTGRTRESGRRLRGKLAAATDVENRPEESAEYCKESRWRTLRHKRPRNLRRRTVRQRRQSLVLGAFAPPARHGYGHDGLADDE